ncbi:lysophospholipase [Rhodobacterales bacterium 56_14_T64]|nr:lysophospholipase [Rhodobacterales bacterium 56_14_T64]
MDNLMNLIKLSVGSESVETLIDWQDMRRAQSADGFARHVTRMWPKREAEIVAGGSIYWVIKGAIQCRQRILRFDEIIGEDGIRRCGFVLDPEIHRTQSALRRPFQGWRYLKPEDSPLDLRVGQATEESLPLEMNQALAEIGVL